jgi:translation initiation factor 1
MSSKKSANPFSALEKLRDHLPVGDVRAEADAKPIAKGPARAVVRLERKHRRGKEVTVVEKLNLPAPQLEAWCRDLKQALGCGGAVEDDTIILQGDLRRRVGLVLTAKGVRQVTISG